MKIPGYFATLSAASIFVIAAPTFAADDLVVIANPSVPLNTIDAQRTTQIFFRKIRIWPNGQSIDPVDLDENTRLRSEFYSKVTGRSAGEIRAYWARQQFTGLGFPPRRLPSTSDVTRYVQSTPGAVGYVNRNAADNSVKVLLSVAP